MRVQKGVLPAPKTNSCQGSIRVSVVSIQVQKDVGVVLGFRGHRAQDDLGVRALKHFGK